MPTSAYECLRVLPAACGLQSTVCFIVLPPCLALKTAIQSSSLALELALGRPPVWLDMAADTEDPLLSIGIALETDEMKQLPSYKRRSWPWKWALIRWLHLLRASPHGVPKIRGIICA